MSSLDEVLEVYRDHYGVFSDKANKIHKEACHEVNRLRLIDVGPRTQSTFILGFLTGGTVTLAILILLVFLVR